MEKLESSNARAIALAHQLGTFNAIDRSRQYEDIRDNPNELLKTINTAWSKIRSLEKDRDAKTREIAELHNKLKWARMKNIAGPRWRW